MNIIMLTTYLIMTTTGFILVKLDGKSLNIDLKKILKLKIGYLTLIGLLFYFCSFLLWQKILIEFNITYIIPFITGATLILIVLSGVIIFKEKIKIHNILGIILITIGIILISINS